MSVGSSYSAVKAALVTQLQARDGLSGVQVLYAAPVNAMEVGGRNGDAIWFDDATGDNDAVVLCGLPARWEETYSLSVAVQSLRSSSHGTQQAADERVDALLFEVLDELAQDPTLGITDFNHLIVTPASFERVTGFLPNGAGHAARCDLSLLVECRHQFT